MRQEQCCQLIFYLGRHCFQCTMGDKRERLSRYVWIIQRHWLGFNGKAKGSWVDRTSAVTDSPSRPKHGGVTTNDPSMNVDLTKTKVFYIWREISWISIICITVKNLACKSHLLFWASHKMSYVIYRMPHNSHLYHNCEKVSWSPLKPRYLVLLS